MNDHVKVLQYVSYILVLVSATSGAWNVYKGKSTKGQSILNFKIWGIGKFLEVFVFKAAKYGSLGLIAQLIPYKVPYSFTGIALGVLAADFMYYWQHRAGHESRVLWCVHSVHHSSPEFNLTTAFRLPWLGHISGWLFSLPLILAGFSVAHVIIGNALVLLYQYWIHTESIGKLGWFDKFFNSPSNHRVHHGSNKLYHDKNYGGIFMIWDRLWGTYESESEKVKYGISEPVLSEHAFVVNFSALRVLARDVASVPTLSDKVKMCLLRPGWTPSEGRFVNHHSAT